MRRKPITHYKPESSLRGCIANVRLHCIDEMNLTGPVCDSADKLTLPDLIGIPSSTCLYTADTCIINLCLQSAMLLLVRYKDVRRTTAAS